MTIQTQSQHLPSLAILAQACLITCAPAVWAGSATADIELPTVRVTSPSLPTPTSLRNTPANSAGFSSQELSEQVNVINTEDIVKYSPDTMTRKRYIGDRNAIIETRTAGVTASARSLVYADGLLLSNLLGNNYAYPPRWNMVLPEEVQRVDFFFGPYSAAYPGNSMGTTVLMSTRMPAKFEATGKVQGFSENYTLYDHHSVNNGGAISATVGNKADRLAWLLGFNQLQSTGHPMQYGLLGSASASAGIPTTGWKQDTDILGNKRIIIGEINQEETTQHSFKAKLSYDLATHLKLQYTLGAWRNDSYNHASSYLKDASGHTITRGIVNVDGINYKIDANSNLSQSTWSQEHWLQALSLQTHGAGAWTGEATLTSYRIARDRQRTSRPDGDKSAGATQTYYGNVNTNPYGDGWHTLDLRARWRPEIAAWQSDGTSHEIQFGYHLDRYTLNSHSYLSDPTGTEHAWEDAPQAALKSSSSGTTQTQALYIQDAWRFLPDWQITPGLRLERWQAFDGSNQKIIGSGTSSTLQEARYADRASQKTSPKLALQYAATEDWLLKASWGQAYRFPTVTELFQSITTGAVLTPNNPALRPERARSTELTAERILDDGVARVSVFSEDMKDAIYQQRTVVDGANGITAATNIDRVATHGVTLAFQQTDAGLKGLDLNGNVTYARSHIRANALDPSTVGNLFPGVPDWRTTWLATYRASPRWSYTLAARYSGHQAYQLDNKDRDQNLYGTNSRFLIVDARVNWKLDNNWRLSAGIDNINNETYFAFHPMPQRTLHIELKAAL